MLRLLGGVLGGLFGLFGGFGMAGLIHWASHGPADGEDLIGLVPVGLLFGTVLGVGLGVGIVWYLEQLHTAQKEREWSRIREKYSAPGPEPIRFDPVWPPAPKRPPIDQSERPSS